MKFKGYIFAIVSAVSFGLIPMFIIPLKQMSFSLDVTLFYRFLMAALMILCIVVYLGEKIRFPIKDLFSYL
ncbi:MAG: EamA/RhaT family transporter, partial [Moheibacter sp.]